MKQARAYTMPSAQKSSPHEAELDRLIDLRANGYITKAEFERDKSAVKRAMAAEARR